ncbi:uncharacterized protein LOC134078113 [Sardina pilchardus]|uniref:uncharacterized protein LOC134078113 n=1 Tax=Sardina pilchardus TaxID=27697 RepID=UPI002E129096
MIETSEGEVVVQVKAEDADASPVNNRITYSLVATEHSSMFAVEPSSGKVYVASPAGLSGNLTLQVMASDPHGLNDTTTVKVVILESRDVVISLNQEIGTVQNKTLEMKEALERALGWSVKIISVSSSMGELALSRTIAIHTLQEKDTPRTYVSFLSTETNGTNVIPKETVQKKLLDDEEKVLVELREVFGPDVQFRVEITGSDTNNSIILGAIIGVALVCIVGGVAAFFGYKRTQSKKHINTGVPMSNIIDNTRDNDSIGSTGDLANDNDSGNMKPDFRKDNDSGNLKPDFRKDNDSGNLKPDFADNDSGNLKPDFADNDSGNLKPDFAAEANVRRKRRPLHRKGILDVVFNEQT